MLDLLVLCLYVLSSLAKKMDNHCSSKIYMDQYKVVEINNAKYEQYKIFDSECEQNKHVTDFKKENKGNIRQDMRFTLQRNVTKRDKKYTTIKRCIEDHLATFYQSYNVSTREEVKVKDRWDSFKKSVDKSITPGNPLVLPIYFSEYKELLDMSKPTPRTYIQMDNLMSQISVLDQLIHSEPIIDSALNLLNNIWIMPELSDSHFLLVAKRYISLLRLRNDFDGIIYLQMKIVERFPYSLVEISKLGEMQYAVRHKSNMQDVFERILEPDQYIVENVESDPVFSIY